MGPILSALSGNHSVKLAVESKFDVLGKEEMYSLHGYFRATSVLSI
jgi:hypothetical protein